MAFYFRNFPNTQRHAGVTGKILRTLKQIGSNLEITSKNLYTSTYYTDLVTQNTPREKLRK